MDINAPTSIGKGTQSESEDGDRLATVLSIKVSPLPISVPTALCQTKRVAGATIRQMKVVSYRFLVARCPVNQTRMTRRMIF